MTFAQMIKHQSQLTLTENGAKTYNTTGSALLDFFARAGALRQNSEEEIISLYLAARKENEELADRLVLWTRDIREGGAGERRVGRILLKTLAVLEPDKVNRNFQKFVELGRWDDLFTLEDTPCEEAMWEFVINQLKEDITNLNAKKPISLLMKWLPSINTSSKETRSLAKILVNLLGISEKRYRKMLSIGRGYLNVVEKKMSAREWDTIDFEIVPSKAMARYKAAFARNSSTFQDYIDSLVNGEAKINAGAIYPYELLRSFFNHYDFAIPEKDRVITEEQWKALPNYVTPGQDVLCVCDCSGSMYDPKLTAISASVGLSLYFAERNSGPYKNMIISFATNPKVIDVSSCATLEEKVKKIIDHDELTTDLDATFKLIYDMAAKTKNAPKALIIVSDDEIDRYAIDSYTDDIITKWQKMFNDIGVKFPKIIFWRADQQSNKNYLTQNIVLASYISGNSPATFKNLTALIDKDAYSAMVEILMNDIYSYK